jgi:hypothetical protein
MVFSLLFFFFPSSHTKLVDLLTEVEVKIMSPNLRVAALGDVEQSLIHVSLSMDGHTVTVRNSDSQQYGGLLNRETAAILTEVFERFEATFRAFILIKQPKKRDAPDHDLYIVIYGTKENGIGIGQALDRAELFLQHPSIVEPSVAYSNPHYLCRPGGSMPTLNACTIFSGSVKDTKVLAENDPLKHQVLGVFDSAQGPQVYSSASTSPRLCTPLKP